MLLAYTGLVGRHTGQLPVDELSRMRKWQWMVRPLRSGENRIVDYVILWYPLFDDNRLMDCLKSPGGRIVKLECRYLGKSWKELQHILTSHRTNSTVCLSSSTLKPNLYFRVDVTYMVFDLRKISRLVGTISNVTAYFIVGLFQWLQAFPMYEYPSIHP